MPKPSVQITSNLARDRDLIQSAMQSQSQLQSQSQSQSQAKDDLRLQANLQVLKRKDPLVSHIVDSTPHVTLYRYTTPTQGSDAPAGWTRDGIEGTMFLFARSSRPTHGIFIMNRLSTSNYYLPLTPDLVWHVSGDYLMFKAQDKNTYGIWFFEQADRRKFFEVITQLCKQEETEAARPAQGAASAPSTTSVGKSGGGASSAKLIASAQNDLMGMIQRARGSPGDPGASSINSTTSSNAAPAPGVSSGDSDMARLMAKLSTAASPALGPAALDSPVNSPPTSAAPDRQPSPKRAKSPTKKSTPAAQASPTKPTAAAASAAATHAPSPAKPATATAPAAAAAPAAQVDPFRLAHATMSLTHTFPPGLPTRESLRDALIARVSSDPMFLDAVWTTYAQMSAAAAASGMGMGMGMPGGALPMGMPPGMGMGIPQNMGLGMRPPHPHTHTHTQGMGPGHGFGGPAPQANGQAHVSPASMALAMGGMPPAGVAAGAMGPMGHMQGQRGGPPAGMYQGQQPQQMRGQGMPMGGGYPQQPR